ncbi:MAG: UTP--glucose-1-phosphate uridylyltransferase [Spirochaetes bacterium]|nr:UTP--glucose-1-phosphate uridylyltransferase [Spirochaetota bacterium]
MIQLSGYDGLIEKIYSYNQEHVFEFWDTLSEEQKLELLNDLKDVDFDQCKEQFKLLKHEIAADTDFSPASYIKSPSTEAEKTDFENAKQEGIRHIKAGKTCAFVVAGGQGSRLGYDGPKGVFAVSPVKNKSLFQIHTEKILKYSRKYDVTIPFFIMTSQLNHSMTVEHFEENNYFGMNRNDVIMFPQNMIPSMDLEGKLILSDKNHIFKNPDGHGGSLIALNTSGAIKEMEKRGIETISYFQIDNPALKIIDPVFIGFHVQNKAEVSNKALIKADPLEKVGNFVKFANGTTGVIEYSDLPDEKAHEKNPDGTIKYAAGSIAIHLFERDFVKKVTSGKDISLPFHIARKKIKKYSADGIKEIDGVKFEKFVFDALPLAGKTITLETVREEEFAPVKNMSGVDSLESSRELMTNLHRSWLQKRNIAIPEKVRNIEISPLLAIEPEDIPSNLEIPDTENVYLE